MSQPTIQVAVVDILKSGEGKTLIENAVKDFICKNDKIFTPVVQHIESKVDQAFSTADVNVLFDKFDSSIYQFFFYRNPSDNNTLWIILA